MADFRTALHLLKSNRLGFCDVIFEKMNKKGWLHWLSDKTFLRISYYLKFGRKLDLKNPKSFNEKLQWLKLYDRRPEYVTMVDKYAVKDYVANIIGAEFIIPTLGVWDRPDDIDFDSLPNQFVLKWNHDSKSVVICEDKKSFDRNKAIEKLRHGEKVNGYWYGREWPYKNVPPKIIAEKYLSQDDPKLHDLTDYKFFCFNGEPKYIQVIQNRRKGGAIDFFDTEWNHQEFIGLNLAAVPSAVMPSRPKAMDEMIKVAKKLSEGIAFSRIDLYETGEHVYFGEVTFYPASRFGEFKPEQWSSIIGEMLTHSGEIESLYNVQVISGLVLLEKCRHSLIDYKFMCFNGKVKCSFVCTGRFSKDGIKVTFYDNDWNIMPFKRCHLRDNIPIEKPYSYDKMVAAAEKLSAGLPFARIDFYEINREPYFGEITLYPGCGYEAFQPDEWDFRMGDWIKLPQ